MSKKSNLCKRRFKNGQAIVEGVVAFWLLIIGLVMAVVLMLYIGQWFNYQIKLQYAAGQAAQYATSKISWLGAIRPTYDPTTLQTDVASAMTPVFNQMGLTGATFTLTPSLSTDPKSVTVTATINGLTLCGANLAVLGASLPAANLKATATALIADAAPPMTLEMCLDGQNPSAEGIAEIPVYYYNYFKGSSPVYPTGSYHQICNMQCNCSGTDSWTTTGSGTRTGSPTVK